MLEIDDFLFDFEHPTSEHLIQIYEHFLDLRNLHVGDYDYKMDDLGKMPKKEWYDALSQLIETYGYEKFLQHLRYNLEGITKLQTSYNKVNRKIKSNERKGIRSHFWDHVQNVNNHKIRLEAPTHYYFYSSDKSRILKGLILSVACVPDPTLVQAIEKFAIECPFQVGSVSQAPTGLYVYDVLEVFSKIPYPSSVQHIMNLKSRIKQTWAQKRFDKNIASIAKKNKIELDKVIELAISDYGFDSSNCYAQSVDEFNFELTFEKGLKKITHWTEKQNNKRQKSIPKTVKENHPEQLKYIKSHVKEIEIQLKTQTRRIEKLYYSDTSWTVEFWLDRYVNHPFIGLIARELFWTLTNEENLIVSVDKNKRFISTDGLPINPNLFKEVRVWHPLHQTNGNAPIEYDQLFKQTKRNVYSIEFLDTVKGTILRKDILSQLCKSRNWTSSSNHNFKIPGSTIKVELLLEDTIDGTRSLDNTSANTIFKGIQFKNKKTQVPSSDINLITLSEILRDVDLFVSQSELKNE